MDVQKAHSRLRAIQRTFTGSASWRRLLVLPDDACVDVSEAQDASQPSVVAVDGKIVGLCRTLPRSLALVISAIGTPHEKSADHIPKFPLLEVLPPAAADAHAPASISIADLWAIIYTLHTLLHTQETIPVVLSPTVTNISELSGYLLTSGLARKRHTLPGDVSSAAEPEHFLIRETFWQGAGTVSYHARGWLRGHCAVLASAPFPYTQTFTRTPLVIAAHPLRPPKPRPGEVIYRRFIPSLGQMLEFTYFDLDVEGAQRTVECEGEQVSPHLATFHRWHNSDHVNRGWGERGPLEKHRAYVQALMADPGVLPVMISWDGELMGYAEMVYIKENHVAPYVPGGAWDYDRGLHVLVGEQKFRGAHRSRAWFSAIHHFLFLSDPRTERVIGEPKAANAAVIKLSEDVGMNVNTKFDFPYKRSVMTWLPRERFFKYDVLASLDDQDTPQRK
ncbi:acyl-CoA N-acyltransferase [Trametes punicea]|nr:acyl-CoA N-acyltransferase [Trametes punicea]